MKTLTRAMDAILDGSETLMGTVITDVVVPVVMGASIGAFTRHNTDLGIWLLWPALVFLLIRPLGTSLRRRYLIRQYHDLMDRHRQIIADSIRTGLVTGHRLLGTSHDDDSDS